MEKVFFIGLWKTWMVVVLLLLICNLFGNKMYDHLIRGKEEEDPLDKYFPES